MKTALLLALLLNSPERSELVTVPCFCGGNPDSKLCCCGDGRCGCLTSATKLEPLTYAQASEKAVKEGKNLVVFVHCKPFDVPGAVSVRDDAYGKRCGWKPNADGYIVIGQLNGNAHIEVSRLLNYGWTAQEIAQRLPGNIQPTGNWRVRDVPVFTQPSQPLRYLNDSPANCAGGS